MKASRLAPIVALAIAAAAVSGDGTAGAGAMPCLSATVHHREHAEGSDGITRELTYRDRFQRCDDNVYIARIVPEVTGGKARHAQGSHEAPDISAMPRHIKRERDGRTALAVLDVEGHRIIEVDRGSFETVRFDPSFERASSVVDKRWLAEMQELDRPSGVAGAHWFGRSDATRFLRVLWDEERGIALAVESGSADRTVCDEVRVEIEASGSTVPAAWRTAKGFPHVDFADFGD